MEEFFWLIIFLFFVVAPLLERVLKGAKGGQPQRRRPESAQRRVPQQRRSLPESRDEREGERPSRQRREAESRDSTDLLPGELWEILTGQREAPTPTQPRRRTTTWDEEADREEAEAAASSRELPAPARDEQKQVAELLAHRDREARERRQYRHTPPVVVSMEREPLPPAARHARFHKKIDKPKTIAPPLELPARDRIVPILRDGSTVDLRRAVLMHEVLGRPKGLDFE